MGYLPQKFAQYESVAQAVCGAFLGSCSVFNSENGFRVRLYGKQTVAFYWRANHGDNWAELAIDSATACGEHRAAEFIDARQGLDGALSSGEWSRLHYSQVRRRGAREGRPGFVKLSPKSP